MGLTTSRFTLNRNQLKYIVIAAMFIDHIAWAFVPTASLLGQVMHFFGRLTGPTMAYFIAEGYRYTRNVKKYAVRLGIFTLLSWIPFVYFEYGTLPVVVRNGTIIAFYPRFGVLYTLLLGAACHLALGSGKMLPRAEICRRFGAVCVVHIWRLADFRCAVLFAFVHLSRESKGEMDGFLRHYSSLLYGHSVFKTVVGESVSDWDFSGAAAHSVLL